MLKNIRKIIALVFFFGLLLLFTGLLTSDSKWLGWIAKIQFAPALMALNFAVITVILLVTLIFGRLYCSIICPIGIFQDIVGRLVHKHKKYHYSKGYPLIRYAFLIAFLAFFGMGAASLAALIDPYSIFGRWTAVGTTNGLVFNLVAIFTFVIILLFGILCGRAYCNNICPVGIILGLFSKFSLFRFRIDKSKCNGCKVCSLRCKGMCINSDTQKVDMERCVNCFNCIYNCKQGAIKYQMCRKK